MARRKPGQVVFADRNGMGAGKGDFPRNVSQQFRDNYDKINWNDSPTTEHKDSE